jgi:hypothetical protein
MEETWVHHVKIVETRWFSTRAKSLPEKFSLPFSRIKDGVIGDIVDTVKNLCALFLQDNAHGSCPAKIRWNRF